MCEPLERAKELLKQIDFSKIASFSDPEHYTLDNGKFHATVAYRIHGIEVMDCTMEPGTTIEPHTHEQIEHMLIYEGDATVDISGVTTMLQPSQSVNIPPLTVHILASDHGAKLLILRIPPVKGLY